MRSKQRDLRSCGANRTSPVEKLLCGATGISHIHQTLVRAISSACTHAAKSPHPPVFGEVSMPSDKEIEVFYERTAHIWRSKSLVDYDLLDMMWAKLDWALAHCRLEVHEEHTTFGTLRVVTALGIIRYHVDPQACEFWGSAMNANGEFQRIGPCFPCIPLFRFRKCPMFWLRLAFQRWAPECSHADLIADPGNRPSIVELATSRVLIRRLRLDARYVTLSYEFEQVLGLPAFVRAHVDEDDQYQIRNCSFESASRVWRSVNAVSGDIRRLMF